MGDSATTIIAIFLAAILMFVFPLMTMADKTDDTVKLTVQTATTDFTNQVRTTGYLSQEDYDNFILTLSSTNNSYDAEIVVQKLDENPAKKASGAYVKIGDNVLVHAGCIIQTMDDKMADEMNELFNEIEGLTI